MSGILCADQTCQSFAKTLWLKLVSYCGAPASSLTNVAPFCLAPPLWHFGLSNLVIDKKQNMAEMQREGSLGQRSPCSGPGKKAAVYTKHWEIQSTACPTLTPS